MYEFTVTEKEQDQRLEKYLKRILKNASTGFIYKMLRKKNITLNGKKAAGNESVKSGDIIRMFLSEETFDKMSRDAGSDDLFEILSHMEFPHVDIVYEDEDICILNKPAGILTQKSSIVDTSLNEEYLAYLISSGMSPQDFERFHPSVANRLDRNTSGIVLCGKNLRGQRFLSEELREKSCRKMYKAIVHGDFNEEYDLDCGIRKDKSSNISCVIPKENMEDGDQPIRSVFYPDHIYGDISLVDVSLLTGKSHQIRASFKYLGYPMAGDPKYGDRELDKRLSPIPKRQMLHANSITFSDGRTYEAPMPEDMKRLIR